MKRDQFRKFITGCYRGVHYFEQNAQDSVTDPSFAMTGTQLAVASLMGQPIPQPSVNYSFNSAISPDDVDIIDKAGADPFEVYAVQRSKEKDVKAAHQMMLDMPEYQEYVKQQTPKHYE